ncbi:MAG: molybdenum cofactor biosynthesis protein [Nitrospirales bacterium]|nr:MAG: molybdenum cofactor biosynthesis protein [Nitrospirales bacterium]
MVRVAVLVISSKIVDGRQDDAGREELERILKEQKFDISAYRIIADERRLIQDALQAFCDTEQVDMVLTVGGTGVRPTDWTPEATKDVIDKEIPGIGEAMRAESLKKIRTAMLSRGIAGIRGQTLIVNLPGSARGARENLLVVLPLLDHTIEKLSGESQTSG